jgi:hypothetical protein
VLRRRLRVVSVMSVSFNLLEETSGAFNWSEELPGANGSVKLNALLGTGGPLTTGGGMSTRMETMSHAKAADPEPPFLPGNVQWLTRKCIWTVAS